MYPDAKPDEIWVFEVEGKRRLFYVTTTSHFGPGGFFVDEIDGNKPIQQLHPFGLEYYKLLTHKSLCPECEKEALIHPGDYLCEECRDSI